MTTTTCSMCGEPWPCAYSSIPHTRHQPTALPSERGPASDIFDGTEEESSAGGEPPPERGLRERFVGTLIGPAGGVVVKSGIQRLDLDLMYGSAPALRVAATLLEGEPHIRVRVLAEEGGQLVERVLYEGPLADAHRPSETEQPARKPLTTWFAGPRMDEDECGALIPTPGGVQ